tara:strand:- start:2789 stop:4216 length:1428 start_codon:yes stop_codon:yes gene_type:complete
MFDDQPRLTPEEILGATTTATRVKHNPLVYPNGNKVSPDCSVIKVKKRYYVLEDGVKHPVIRQSSLASGRWQYYNGEDVDKSLIQEDFKNLKGVNALTIDGVPVPIFRKDYLLKYNLMTKDNAEVLEKNTPVVLNKDMKIIVAGTDRIVTTIQRKHSNFSRNRPKKELIDCSIPASKQKNDANTCVRKRKPDVLEMKKNKIVAETISHLTAEDILQDKDQKSNRLIYPDGTPVDTEENVIKRNKRHRVVKPDGQEISVIRASTKRTSRHVFYHGKDVDDTLEIHNKNAHKSLSSYVIIDDIRIPVSTKMALAKYILVDTQTGAHILPDTPIKLVRNNEIFTQETDKPLTRLRVKEKNKIPGFENLFPVVRQKKISKKSSSEIASASVLPTLLENSFFSDEAFDFEMDTMDIGEDVVEAVVTNVPDSSTNLYTPNFFNARPSTPPIMDPNKLEVFTPGEEDPQRAAQVLIRGQIYL